MKTAMTAIIKKDFRGVTDNKHLFASLLIVPLVLTIVLPSVFLVMIHFAPDDPDIQRLLELLPQSMQTKSLEQGLAELVLNFMLPVFFLIIPIMSASIMAASSFVGEKEKQAGTVAVRERGGRNIGAMSFDDFAAMLAAQVADHTNIEVNK